MLDQIQAPILKHMRSFDRKFRTEIRSQVTLLDMIMAYILRRKGKRIRPILVFLSAGLYGEINERSYRAAMLMELLHTATLIHDDVVDGAAKRRGLFSIHSVWKNKIAVLVGDFLLSRGLLLALRHKDYALLHLLTTAVEQMSEGELLQAQKTRKLNMRYEEYLQIIEKKTASLLATCCQLGAASTGASPEQLNRMYDLGRALGIAFQMRDDLFDYEENGPAGKPFALDIQQKKITLPLLYALAQCGPQERRRIRHLLRHKSHRAAVRKDIVSFVEDFGGLSHTRTHMQQYGAKALALLEECAESPYRKALQQLIHFAMQRRK